MPRKHRRDDTDHVPLEIDPENIPTPRPTRWETEEERERRLELEFGRRRERNDRRVDDRVAAAVDWEVCCVIGCGTSIKAPKHMRRPEWQHVAPDVAERLPICTRHEVIITKRATVFWEDPDHVRARMALARQRVSKTIERAARADMIDESNGSEEGQIYFVRLNDMVKVGWSLKLRTRLKAYGASAEVLCHYPASRQDETLLHRQLKPFRAKGREWYQDCKLISDVVAGIVERHGEPCIFPRWTEPKPDVVAGKRAS